MNHLRLTTLASIACLILSACSSGEPVATPQTAPAANAVETGRYLAQVGDCVACHTMPGAAEYSGGRAIATPFGTVYSTNLTPDPDTGLGRWSADDFWQALHEGRSKRLGLLYPAFPYTNFTQVSRSDSDALFAYLKSLAPVRSATPPAQLRFPFNLRPLLAVWRLLYFSPGTYVPDPAKAEAWNRGAYLVQGLGHCDACHSERGLLGAVPASKALRGGTAGGGDWYAPDLAGHVESAGAVAQFLRSGVAAQQAASGPMAEVVYNSTRFLSVDDAQAIATYLGSLAQAPAPAAAGSGLLGEAETSVVKLRGRQVYTRYCQDCHAADGSGRLPAYPPLAGNRAVLDSVANPVRAIANGGFPPATQENPRPYGMPAFLAELSDADIAAVLSYVRGAWGNDAAAVSPVEVERYKVAPAD